MHTQFVPDDYVPNAGDISTMISASRNGGAFGLHFGAFMPTILSRASLRSCHFVVASPQI